MLRLRLKPTYKFLDYQRLKSSQITLRLSGQPLGQRRTGGDRSRAALRFITRLGHLASLKADRQPQDITTDRIADLYGHRRLLQFAHVARIAKVVDQTLAVHSFQE